MTVIPSVLFSSRTVRMTSARPPGSSIAVGSSSTMHFGFIAITPAIATRCFWPPESLFGELSRYSHMPTAFRAFRTLSQISFVGTPIFSGPNPASSSTTEAMI